MNTLDWSLLKKNKEVFNYLFFGALTTFLNFIVYAVLTRSLQADYKTATSAAWLVAVLFAYLTNKRYVFQSACTDLIALAREFGSFFLSRILSYGLDIFSMILLVGILRADDFLSKIAANAIVIVFNYLAGKFYVFKSRNSHE